MGIALLIATLLYSSIMFSAIVSNIRAVAQNKLLSRSFVATALIIAPGWAVVLWLFGLNAKSVSLEYRNISTVWYGLLNWFTASTAVGSFAFLFAKRSPVLVGMSCGFTTAAVFWFIHIWSLTEWR